MNNKNNHNHSDIKTDFQSLYNALLRRDKLYNDKAWVCVKSTRIYCRLTCGARKPLETNVEFVFSIEDAIKKGYRPCKRCKPDEVLRPISELSQKMLKLLHDEPLKRWDSDSIKELGIDSGTLRRNFQRDFGTTFLQYARQHRLGAIVTDIENGAKIINAQIDAGYDSSSGFVDAIKKQIGSAPSNIKGQCILSAKWIETPIGIMLAIVNDDGLHLLEFAERKGLPTEINNLKKKVGVIIFRSHNLHGLVEKELNEYFKGVRKSFTVPVTQYGTAFEKQVWKQLQLIQYGKTRSYKEQAEAINNPNAVRAVARANGANKVAIIIPCHRVIGSDGSMTGYAGKIWRKEWLLNHEAKIIQKQEQS